MAKAKVIEHKCAVCDRPVQEKKDAWDLGDGGPYLCPKCIRPAIAIAMALKAPPGVPLSRAVLVIEEHQRDVKLSLIGGKSSPAGRIGHHLAKLAMSATANLERIMDAKADNPQRAKPQRNAGAKSQRHAGAKSQRSETDVAETKIGESGKRGSKSKGELEPTRKRGLATRSDRDESRPRPEPARGGDPRPGAAKVRDRSSPPAGSGRGRKPKSAGK